MCKFANDLMYQSTDPDSISLWRDKLYGSRIHFVSAGQGVLINNSFSKHTFKYV